MAGYTKSWTDKFQDEWYMSLDLPERGLYDQLPPYAKQNGDTGTIVFRNWHQIASQFGGSETTIRRIFAKLEGDLKIKIKIEKKTITIFIVNYEYNQRVRGINSPPASQIEGQSGARLAALSRAEQIRAEQSRAENTQTPSIQNPQVEEIYQKVLMSDLGPLLKPEGRKWIAGLIDYFDLKKVQAGFDSMIKSILDGEYTITKRESARKWIGREKEKGGQSDDIAGEYFRKSIEDI